MANITTRAGKGSRLTWNEVDANFNNLNSDKVDKLTTSDQSVASNFNIDKTAGNNRILGWLTAGIVRWRINVDSSAESGSNAGSNFAINRYSDAGAFIETSFGVTRSTGIPFFAKMPTVNGIALDTTFYPKTGGAIGDQSLVAGWPALGTPKARVLDSFNTGKDGGFEIHSYAPFMVLHDQSTSSRNARLKQDGDIFSIGFDTTAAPNTFTDWMQISAGGYAAFGGTITANVAVTTRATITGTGTTQYGHLINTTFNESATAGIRGIEVQPILKDATYTVGNVTGFNAGSPVIPAAVTVTDYSQFRANDFTPTGTVTNRFGFRGDIASGTNRWNLYMNGSASNYLNGSLYVGSTTGLTGSTDKVQVSGTVAANNLSATGVSGTNRELAFKTNGVIRWHWQCTGEAESGGNTGSNLYLNRFADDGNYLASVLSIGRNSGIVNFIASPTFPTPAANDNSTKGATTAFVSAQDILYATREPDLIINPHGSIQQETTTPQTTPGVYFADQWQFALIGSSIAVQAGVASNSVSLFDANNLYIKTTTAKASLASGDLSIIQQPIEGRYVRRLLYGTSLGRGSWLRWRASSTQSGTASVAIRGGSPTRSFVQSFAVTTTPTDYSLFIPADTAGAGWVSDNTMAARVTFCHAGGSGTQTSTLGAWHTGDFIAAPTQSNMLDTVNRELRITDVSWKSSSVLLPFVPIDWEVEIERCLRYWRGETGMSYWGNQSGSSDSFRNWLVQFGIPMRVAPHTVIATSPQGGVGIQNARPTSVSLNINMGNTTSSASLESYIASARM